MNFVYRYICLQLILKRNTNPLKCTDIFFLPVSQYQYYNPSDLEVILTIRMVDSTNAKKPSKSHFNDTNRKYDVQKSYPEVIFMIRTEDTTYKNAI